MSEMTQRDDRNETEMKQGILVYLMVSLLALPFCEFTVGCDLAVVKSIRILQMLLLVMVSAIVFSLILSYDKDLISITRV